mgnify:CR=1 FL=1
MMYSKRYSSITFEELQPFFVMDEITASQELGYSLSTFKKMCQNLGIKMWPYRQIRCLSNIINVFKYLSLTDPEKYNVKLEPLIPMYEELVKTGRVNKGFTKTIAKPNHKIVKKYINVYKEYLASLNAEPDIRMTIGYILN